MKYQISITKTYSVAKVEEVELEFDSLDEAEEWFYTEAFYDYLEDLKFQDEEWEERDTEARILNNPSDKENK